MIARLFFLLLSCLAHTLAAQKAGNVVWTPAPQNVGIAIAECGVYQPSGLFSAGSSNDCDQGLISSLILVWNENAARIMAHQGCNCDGGNIGRYGEKDLIAVIDAARFWKFEGSLLLEPSNFTKAFWEFSWYGDGCCPVTLSPNDVIYIWNLDGRHFRSTRRDE